MRYIYKVVSMEPDQYIMMINMIMTHSIVKKSVGLWEKGWW